MKKRLVRPKILYIGDKWCAGDLKRGLSEWEGNLWKSLKSTDLVNLELFHFDDYYHNFKKPGDAALIKKIDKFNPDIICLVIYRMPGSSFNVPKWKTLDLIKNYYKIPIAIVWSDLEIAEQVEIFEALLPYTSINAATASPAAVRRINNPKKCIYMWVPKDPKVFNNPHKKRDIDVSYAGYPKEDRLDQISCMVKNGIDVYNHGGESKEHLTTLKYADIYERSKITLSFARAHYSHVINARPFEAMNCGAMVLEQESFEMPKLFIPFVDYVPYTSKTDLLEKIKYYLKHDKKREAIARNGYKKVTNLYSARRFWQLVIDRALKRTDQNNNNLLFLKPSNLSHLPQWNILKLRFLDKLCSNKWGFKTYQTITKAIDVGYWKRQFDIMLGRAKMFSKKHLSPDIFKMVLKTARCVFQSINK